MSERLTYMTPESKVDLPAKALDLQQEKRRLLLTSALVVTTGLTAVGSLLVGGVTAGLGGLAVIDGGIIAVAAMHYRYLHAKNKEKK